MHDSGDVMADSAATIEVVERAGSDDKVLLLVPDGDHPLLRDLDRDATLAAIIDWIDARCP
jgi:alpha-beta hydrolase superfamily lysophospholipase